MKQHHLFILSNGRVAAINKNDGTIVWEVKLRTYLDSKMSLNFGQISLEDNKLFIASTGMLLCLDAKDGSLLWKNELKGWGYNFVSMANDGNEAVIAGSSHAAATSAVIAST